MTDQPSLLRAATARLTAVAGDARGARAEAEWLLAHVLGSTRTAVQAGLAPAVEAEARARFDTLVQVRAGGLPFAYVTAEQPFRSLSIAVTPAVLIPRPETEQLVDWALALLQQHAPSPTTARPQVLDVCTGSGCVAIALALEAPHAELWASDLSPEALAVAAQNVATHGDKVRLVQADGLALPPECPARFELIVGNPPYIAEGDAHLPALAHEPQLALVSGVDGLALIRRLVVAAPQRLHPGGALLLEHGYDQAGTVQELFRTAGFTAVRSHRDYGGQWRATEGRLTLG